MHTARPAPLLLVALAFSVGGYLGLSRGWTTEHWLLACGVLACVWCGFFLLARMKRPAATGIAYAVLLALTVAVGGFHGSLREGVTRADDLRILPDEKASPRSQWRGEINGDPRFRPRKDREDSGRTTLVLKVTHWRTASAAAMNGPWQPASGLLQVRVDQTAPDSYHYGDIVEVTGGLQEPPKANNPGQFDIATYLWQRDIYYQIAVKAEAITCVSTRGGDALTRLAWQARDWSLTQLRRGIEDDPATSALLAGMLIGYVEDVPAELETAFRNTGTYHIFAVSGQNVAVICGVGLVALQMCGLVRWRWGWLLVPLLIFYCLITGGQPSAVRALLMAVLVLVAWSLERPVAMLNLWSIALLAVMVYDPKLVGNLSFQLSFAVVGSIIVLTPIFYHAFLRGCGLDEPPAADDSLPDESIAKKLGPWRRTLIRAVRGLLLLVASSLAAWLGSLPLMAWYFHQVTVVGLVANLVVVPLAGVIVVVGALALAMAPLSGALTAVINNANWLLAKGLVWIVSMFAQIPGGYFYVPDPSVTWRLAEPEFVCAAAGGTTVLLLRYGDKAWLINTGTESQFRYVANPLRKFYGVNQLEGAVLTELGSLQAGGALLLESEKITGWWATPPQQKITPTLKPWLQAVTRNGATPHIWYSGHEETLAPGLTVTTYWPGEENVARRMEDRGLVLRFRYQARGLERTLLYAGRIGQDSEAQLIAQFPALHADVLVQGWHGTKPNLGLDWLRAIAPRQVILAPSTSYSGERMDSIELLPEAERPQVWRQDETGAVTVRLTAEGVVATSFVPAQP